MEYNSALIAIIAATFFLAGLVKGVTGMGLPTTVMGILGAVISPVAAAGLLLVPSLLTNIWQLIRGPNLGAVVMRLWPMMLTLAIATLLSSALLTNADRGETTTALGAVLVLYAAYTLLGRPLRVPPNWEPAASPISGFVTGIVTGGTGIFVVPAVPYLQSLGFQKDDLVQALGLSFTTSTIALAIGLGWHHAISASTWLISAAAVGPAVFGMAVGQALRAKIGAHTFRNLFIGCLMLLGLEMVLRAL